MRLPLACPTKAKNLFAIRYYMWLQCDASLPNSAQDRIHKFLPLHVHAFGKLVGIPFAIHEFAHHAAQFGHVAASAHHLFGHIFASICNASGLPRPAALIMLAKPRGGQAGSGFAFGSGRVEGS